MKRVVLVLATLIAGLEVGVVQAGKNAMQQALEAQDRPDLAAIHGGLNSLANAVDVPKGTGGISKVNAAIKYNHLTSMLDSAAKKSTADLSFPQVEKQAKKIGKAVDGFLGAFEQHLPADVVEDLHNMPQDELDRFLEDSQREAESAGGELHKAAGELKFQAGRLGGAYGDRVRVTERLRDAVVTAMKKHKAESRRDQAQEENTRRQKEGQPEAQGAEEGPR
jgi:hypothetical protein